MKPIVHASYNPPRVFLPNILSGYEEDLSSYNITQKTVATDLLKNQQDQGFIHVKMQEWNKRHKLKALPDVDFNDTAKISVSSSGFKKLNSVRVFIPKLMTMRFSRNPIAIMNISVKIKVLDALGLGQTRQEVEARLQQTRNEGGIIANIVAELLKGDATVNIALLDQEGIREFKSSDQKEQRNTTDNL